MAKMWNNLRFFKDLHLPKRQNAIILSTLMVCALGGTCAYGSGPDGGTSPGVTVTIKPTDAHRLRELNRLRGELAAAAERVRRLELENESLRENRADLRAELIEIKEKFNRQNESLRQLRLWLAGVPAEGTVRKTGRREEQLVGVLAELSKSGGELALDAVTFCDLVRALLREVPIGKVRQAEIQLKLDSLARSARRFIALTGPETAAENGADPLRTCRILAVDSELSIVVLSVGSAKGVFTGMIYRVGKDRPIQLRVVAVRPYVAAAEVVKGGIGDLAPGMEAVAGETREAAGAQSSAVSNKKQQK